MYLDLLIPITIHVDYRILNKFWIKTRHSRSPYNYTLYIDVVIIHVDTKSVSAVFNRDNWDRVINSQRFVGLSYILQLHKQNLIVKKRKRCVKLCRVQNVVRRRIFPNALPSLMDISECYYLARSFFMMPFL